MPALIASAHTSWPTVAQVIAVLGFLGVLALLFVVPSARWRRDARIPLDEERRVGAHKEDNDEQ